MIQASRLAKLEPARPRTRAASVAAVDNAGILKLKVLYTVNIEMVFYHPKYYKELRNRNKSDQAISHANSTRGPSDVRPDPGLKPQAPEASSRKPQAPSSKLQAPSHKLQVPRSLNHGKVSRYLNRGALA